MEISVIVKFCHILVVVLLHRDKTSMSWLLRNSKPILLCILRIKTMLRIKLCLSNEKDTSKCIWNKVPNTYKQEMV